MKIPFLFNVGCAYCATSPLWRTLQHDTKYLHTGHRKKTHWLYVLQYQDQFQWNREQQDNTGALASYNRWQGRASKFLAVPRGHLISDDSREETKFTREEDNYFFSLPTSIEKYIEYYKRLNLIFLRVTLYSTLLARLFFAAKACQFLCLSFIA